MYRSSLLAALSILAVASAPADQAPQAASATARGVAVAPGIRYDEPGPQPILKRHPLLLRRRVRVRHGPADASDPSLPVHADLTVDVIEGELTRLARTRRGFLGDRAARRLRDRLARAGLSAHHLGTPPPTSPA